MDIYLRSDPQQQNQFMEPVTKQVVLVSIHFMILFTAFNAFQTIVTSINESEGDRNLGPFRFSLNYTAFLIANFFAPSCKYSQKWQILFATLTYVLHYLTGFFVADTQQSLKYIMAALGAIINGIGASFLWTSIGRYIHKVCVLYHKEEYRGHYVGLFNTIFCSSTVLGALVVTFGLSSFSTSVYFGIVAGVAMLAFFYGVIFIKDIKLPNQEELQTQTQKTNILKMAKNAAVKTLKYYPIMKYTLGLIVLDGMCLGVVTSTMLHLLPALQDKTQMHLNAGFCLLSYGVACVIGGFLGGKITDYLKIRISSIILLMLYCLACLFSIAAEQIMELWSALVGCAIWGFTMYYLTGLLMVICSRLYKGAPESFALVKQFHSFAFVVYEIVAMTTNNQIPILYLMIGLLVIGLPALWGIVKSPEEQKQQTTTCQQNQTNPNQLPNKETIQNEQSLIEK